MVVLEEVELGVVLEEVELGVDLLVVVMVAVP